VKNIKLIFIGREFYNKSNTRMASLYTEDWEHSDWAYVETALAEGHRVSIRPAKQGELQLAQRVLNNILDDNEIEEKKW